MKHRELRPGSIGARQLGMDPLTKRLAAQEARGRPQRGAFDRDHQQGQRGTRAGHAGRQLLLTATGGREQDQSTDRATVAIESNRHGAQRGVAVAGRGLKKSVWIVWEQMGVGMRGVGVQAQRTGRTVRRLTCDTDGLAEGGRERRAALEPDEDLRHRVPLRHWFSALPPNGISFPTSAGPFRDGAPVP